MVKAITAVTAAAVTSVLGAAAVTRRRVVIGAAAMTRRRLVIGAAAVTRRRLVTAAPTPSAWAGL